VSVAQRAPIVTAAVAVALVIGLVAAVLAAVVVLPRRGGTAGGGGAEAAGAATVVRVVDGDTVVVEVGGTEESVRLIGIDTPESVARDRPNECFGAEASARLSSLLPAGTAVVLTRDVEPRDLYDRLLAYVQRSSDGLFLNAAQVADGYAEAKDYPPNTAYRDDFEQAERTARAAGLGLWSACGGPDVALAPAPRAP
jgi:micrococcal nuclease